MSPDSKLPPSIYGVEIVCRMQLCLARGNFLFYYLVALCGQSCLAPGDVRCNISPYCSLPWAWNPISCCYRRSFYVFIMPSHLVLGLPSLFSPLLHKLDLTTFFLYLSKITSNLPENYLSRSKTTCKNKLLK